MFQGHFTHYTNKWLVAHTTWYHPSIKYGVIDLTTHTLHNDNYISHKLIQNLKYKNNTVQPEMSHTKNCTALILIKSEKGSFPMITIPCNKRFETSLVCEMIQIRPPISVKESVLKSHVCEDEWFTVRGTRKCFSFTWTKGEVSYNDAHDMCMSQHAKVLTVEVRSVESADITPEIYALLYNSDSKRMSTNYYIALFGQPLTTKSPQGRLLNIIFHLTNTTSDMFFTNLHNKCSLVERLYYNNPSYKSYSTERWGVKCQPCAEASNVSAVICEKNSRPYIMQCQDEYFTCVDGTCILLIYKCDLISDCFDGSDEDFCNGTTNSSWYSSSFALPCHHGVLCDGPNQMIVPLHTICDGVYSNTTLFVQEEYACSHFELEHINLLELSKGEVGQIAKETSPCRRPRSAIDKKKVKYTKSMDRYYIKCRQKGATDVSNYHSKRVMSDSVLCTKEHDTRLMEKCKIGINASYGAIATANDVYNSCHWFACPGMFKCSESYCIPISAVCDGQYDCKYGGDEFFCPLLSCPGFLKCRGENRCVGIDEICDDNLNCLYSMDDEVGCNKCPDSCHCDGYSLSCEVNNSLDVLSSQINHFKGFVMEGVQKIFNINLIHLIGLVFFNVSFCDINKVHIQENDLILNSFIVISDFSDNKIANINFLEIRIFKNVVFLDLSFNLISVIKNVLLDKIVFLALKGNPLNYIVINAFQHNVKSLIDMQYVYYRTKINIQFSSAFSKQLEVKVSEALICCVMSKHIKCTSFLKTINCFGIFNIKTEQILAYCITTFSVLAAVVLFTKHIISVWLIRKQLTSKKRYFTILLLNQSGAVVVSSIYALGILVADVTGVNISIWTTSHICLFLNSLLYISLVSNMIYKTTLLIFVSLQIIYPFKHQCLCLRWTAVFSAIAWLLICSTYSVNMIERILYRDTYRSDYLCSVAGCGVKGTIHLLLYIICLSDCFLISISIYMLIQAYISLAKSNKASDLSANNRRNIKITFKVSCPVTLEIPFRICLVLVLVIQLANASNKELCDYIFMYILPINTIYTSLFSVYQYWILKCLAQPKYFNPFLAVLFVLYCFKWRKIVIFFLNIHLLNWVMWVTEHLPQTILSITVTYYLA